jgi:CheY-like chemotaxis protein
MTAPPLILLVEDDPNDVLLFRRALGIARVAGELRVAVDGEHAIECLAGVPAGGRLPSVVILDLKLPRASGFQVLAWLRAQPRLNGMPVVVLTSSALAADVAEAYRLGASSYLVKPVDSGGLVRLVSALGEYWLTLNRTPSYAHAGAVT